MMSYLADLFGVDKLKRLIVSIKELLFVICLIVIQGFLFTPVLASAFAHLLQSAIEKSVLKFWPLSSVVMKTLFSFFRLLCIFFLEPTECIFYVDGQEDVGAKT